MSPPPAPAPRGQPHPRNRHRARYDFPALIRADAALAAWVHPHPEGGDTIDFNSPAAVRALNRALLIADYGLTWWELPPGYLCPPVPGRADYVHHAADLLADDAGVVPRGPAVSVLDIGVGANCIYPIIGVHDYGWHFVGSDIDPGALRSAEALIAANASLSGRVSCRLQPDRSSLLSGVVRPADRFALTLCNPPFHPSLAAATAGNRRSHPASGLTTTRNFGGQPHELWCPGGEAAFVGQLIAESAHYGAQIRWFTALISSRGSLPVLQRSLARLPTTAIRVMPLGQGQKQSRLLAWTFQPTGGRASAVRQS